MARHTANYSLVKPDETDFYDIGVHNGNMDVIDGALKDIEDTKEPRSLKGTITVDNTNWVSGSYGEGMAYRKQVPIAGVTSAEFPIIAFDLSTKEVANDARTTHVKSYNGGIYLYSESIPTGSITFDYRVIRG